MSIYNSLFGVNKAAPILLNMLKLSSADFGRFRDCYLNEDGSKIIVYTRCGGGNREDYQEVFIAMENHPHYLSNWDDGFDSTYAYFEFSIPDEFKEDLKSVAGERQTPSEKFEQLIRDLQDGNKNPQTDKAMEVGGKIVGEIKKALDSGDNKVIEV